MPSDAVTPFPSMLWSAEFELGIAEIDNQHRRLLGRVNAFAQATMQGGAATAAMAELLQAAVAHFAYEETLMRRAGYAATPLHLEQHAELLASMERLQARMSLRQHEADRRRTLDFLHDWFTLHIRYSDADLARHLKALEPA